MTVDRDKAQSEARRRIEREASRNGTRERRIAQTGMRRYLAAELERTTADERRARASSKESVAGREDDTGSE